MPWVVQSNRSDVHLVLAMMLVTVKNNFLSLGSVCHVVLQFVCCGCFEYVYECKWLVAGIVWTFVIQGFILLLSFKVNYWKYLHRFEFSFFLLWWWQWSAEFLADNVIKCQTRCLNQYSLFSGSGVYVCFLFCEYCLFVNVVL